MDSPLLKDSRTVVVLLAVSCCLSEEWLDASSPLGLSGSGSLLVPGSPWTSWWSSWLLFSDHEIKLWAAANNSNHFHGTDQIHIFKSIDWMDSNWNSKSLPRQSPPGRPRVHHQHSVTGLLWMTEKTIGSVASEWSCLFVPWSKNVEKDERKI